MKNLLETMLYIHVVGGFLGLAAFWVPVFTRKGAKIHRSFGKLFVYTAYVVLGSAGLSVALRVATLIAAGEAPRDRPATYAFMVFLGYLSFITLVIIRYGVGVLDTKKAPDTLATPLNRALAWGNIAASLIVIGWALLLSPPNWIILLALSPIGLATGIGMLRYLSGRRISDRAWLYEHLGSMLGSGIAFHTAFAVLGAGRLFDLGLTGGVAVIPWILPAVVGIPAITLWQRHYRRKFGDLKGLPAG